MRQEEFIHDLIMWIEKNLHYEMSIEKVSEQSGYSKWHLQRLFREVTGQKVGSYIRARKLTRAAVALKLTRSPVIDIARKFAFDTQQSFTRAFKRQFHLSPGEYRRQSDWFTGDLCPPIDKGITSLPLPHYVRLTPKILTGQFHSYSCSPEQSAKEYTDRRNAYWEMFRKNWGKKPDLLYGLYKSEPHHIHREKKGVVYFTAHERKEGQHSTVWDDECSLREGNYVMFIYEGEVNGFQDFIITVYRLCLPLLRITRRSGYDVEVFRCPIADCDGQGNKIIHCEYHIPIK